MFRRFAAAGAGGALALLSYSVMVVAPASAGPVPLLPNTVKVIKVVVGDSKGTGFEVVVTCEQKEAPASVAVDGFTHTETLTFGPQGGTETAGAPFNSTCTIVETHDGGASKVEVSPSTCEFTNELTRAVEGQTCEVTVTNTFVPEQEEAGPAGPAGPQGPPGPPGESAVAATAVVSTARFTG